MLADIGFSEILVVACVALVVTKPEDVPGLMRKAGVATAHLRHFMQGMWAGFTESMQARADQRASGEDEAAG